MPSSDIEIVPPADGRGETLAYLAVCISVLALASLLLVLFSNPTHTTLSELPKSLTNIATQISNAQEEILVMQEAGLISEPWALDQLNLPSTHDHSFKQVDEHCFLLELEGHVFSLEYEKPIWQAKWAKAHDIITTCHDALEWHPLNQ